MVIIGFITHENTTLKYLGDFCASLKRQTYQDTQILAVDNSENNQANLIWLKNNYPAVKTIAAGRNLGFAKAANLLINQAVALGAEYFFLANPDTLLEPDVLEILVKAAEANNNLTALSPRVLKWDFQNKKKTEIIDTLGIIIKPGLLFVDAKNLGGKISGPSGAAAFFNLKNLGATIRFDEDFFMYKEDCDLAYQLFKAGKHCALAPEAIVYHDRTTNASRSERSRQEKIWSYQNQNLLFKKYWSEQNTLNKILIIFYKICRYIYALMFEKYLLK